MTKKKAQGIGIGLRVGLAEELFATPDAPIDFVEIHPENYVERGGRFDTMLKQANERYPLVFHGLTLNFGNATPFEETQLRATADFLHHWEAEWYSDHLCFGASGSHHAHDLLPIAFDQEMEDIVCARLGQAQDALGLPIAAENISYYAKQGEDPLEEARFISRIVERSGCKLLLDVNNIVVNSKNLGFDPLTFLEMIPSDAVIQYHVAGHLLRKNGLRIDTHGEPIPQDVYELLPHALRRFGDHPILLERDNNIPPFDELMDEVKELREIANKVWEEAA